MTCRSLCAISCMMTAIFSAILPLTPVSISSKMIVGSFTALLIIAFSESITLAISPPDATCETGCSSLFVFALNMNDTLSQPSCIYSFSSIRIRNFTLGMPRGTSRFFIPSSTIFAAFFRVAVSREAFFLHISKASFSFCSSSFSSSSLLSILLSCSPNESCISNRASTESV